MLSRRRDSVLHFVCVCVCFGILCGENNYTSWCKEGKTLDVEAKLLLCGDVTWWRCFSCTLVKRWEVCSGPWCLLRLPMGWPRCWILAGETKTQIGPRTSSQELEKPYQRFVLLQTNTWSQGTPARALPSRRYMDSVQVFH